MVDAQPMSAVGTGEHVEMLPRPTWNNPEPEVVLVVTPAGRIGGPTIENDVTLRDCVVIPPLLTYSPAVMSGVGPLPNLKLLNRHDHSPGALPFLPAPLWCSAPGGIGGSGTTLL